MSEASDEVRHLSLADMPTQDQWRQILSLAKRHKGTVGWLPDSAFSDRLRKGTLTTVWRGSRLLGYCLYDLQRSGSIKLIHVCSAARGSGVGKRLIDEVIARHPSATGVLAWCRRDWGLAPFWSRAGLTPRAERPGRAKKGSTLSAWWRQLGALDLFEEAALGAGLPVVMVDTNVVSDWYGSPEVHRPTRVASQALLADNVQAEITIVLSPRADIELDQIADKKERDRQRAAADHHVRVRSLTADDATTYNALISRVEPAQLQADLSLREDLHHVADALDNSVQYFVTNDEGCLTLADQYLPNGSSLAVLRPHELIRRLEEQLQYPPFQSRFIESIDLQWVPAGSVSEQRLVDAFGSQETRERGRDLKGTLRTAMAVDPTSCRTLVDPSGEPWALVIQTSDVDSLNVSLLRVLRGARSATIAAQMARHLRELARVSRLAHVRVVDAGMTVVTNDALRADGYERDGDGYTATLIDDAREVSDFLPGVVPPVSVSSVRGLERRYWPLVLLGAELPTYITPIQPRFIDKLFGIQRPTLWSDRSRALGLSREHVYYSGSDRSLPEEGARILWYVTADPTGTYRAVMATSRSLGFERLAPEEAFEKYSGIGVLRLRDVRRAAGKRDGKVSVIRFEDTEIFNNPISGGPLRELREQHGVKGAIQSFRPIPPAMFDDVARAQGRGGGLQ